MTVNRPRTRLTTLHRLVPEVRPSHEDMFDAYTEQYTERPARRAWTPSVGSSTSAEAPAIWIGVQGVSDRAEWCADASVTTGLDVAYTDCRSGGVLLLGIDGTAYAMSYGNGYLLMPDELKDQRFGLQFLVRRLNPEQVSDVVRRRPDARGRTDSTLVAAGAPVWTLGIAENVEIIRRIGGRAKDLKVTFSAQRQPRRSTWRARPVCGCGSASSPHALVADIRECERVCREEEPDPALEFVEYVQPVTDAGYEGRTRRRVGETARRDAPDAAEHLIPVVPTSVLEHFGQAHSFTIRIGRARTVPRAVAGARRTSSAGPGYSETASASRRCAAGT